jgi:hypothetical protein
MPATPEQWIAALSQTYWTTPGSTGRRTDPLTATRTATRTEAPVNVNVRTLDKASEGRDIVTRAARLAAEGTPLARREATAIRDAFVMEAEELAGATETVRTRPCPACGCFTLLPVKGKAQCVNRHCAPRPGLRRRWTYRDLAYVKPGRPRGVQRSAGYPADLRTLAFLVDFLAQCGHTVPLPTLTRWVKLHNLPRWPVDGKTYAYSLSDVATVHAVQLAGRTGQPCESGARPVCAGLADLFFNTDDQTPAMDQALARRRIEVAKQLCDECPFKAPCLDSAPAARRQAAARRCRGPDLPRAPRAEGRPLATSPGPADHGQHGSDPSRGTHYHQTTEPRGARHGPVHAQEQRRGRLPHWCRPGRARPEGGQGHRARGAADRTQCAPADPARLPRSHFRPLTHPAPVQP